METPTTASEPDVFRVVGPRRVFLAWLLLASNVLWFAWMSFHGVSMLEPDDPGLVRHGADFGPLVAEGEWWRILSSAFVHIGLIHIAVNMYALWSLGPAVERLFGNAAFLAIYLAGAIGCSLLSLYVHPAGLSAGASGAIFALAGALLAFVVAHKDAMPKAAFRGSLRSMGMFLVVNLIIGVSVPNISLSGHAGGFVTGFVAALALDRDPARAPRLDLRRAARGVVLAIVLAVAGVLVVRHVSQDPAVVGERTLTKAEAASAAEEWERVDELASSVLASDPGSKKALAYRAFARARLHRLEGALSDCDLLLEGVDEKTSAPMRRFRAGIQLELGDFAAARADYDRLIALDKNKGDYRAYLGLALLGQQEWAAAERSFEAALRNSDSLTDWSADIGLWIARQMTGQRANADEGLREFEFSPRGTKADAHTQFLLSVALGKEGERSGGPFASEANVLRALRRVQAGNFDEARSEAERVIAEMPRSWEASVARAIVAQLSSRR